MNRASRILRLDASANPADSTSRMLGDQLLERISGLEPAVELRQRDLGADAQFIDAGWIDANLNAADARGAAERARLAVSDELIAELNWADRVLLTTPMYNFGVPATLKAWIDQVCRAGITFRYTSDGPVGLLEGKRADIVVTTGGVPLGSGADFLSGYLRHVFGFIGIDEVDIFSAEGMNRDAESSVERAMQQIEACYPAAAA